MKAQALWITAPEVMEIREEELPAPKYDELQIQTKAVGICAWDSYLYRGMSAPGPLPYRLGHEGVGVVTAMGEGVKGFQVGDKIFVGTGGDEMMASAFNVQYDCVAKIPEGETDYAKWVGEPAVCIVNVLQKADIQPGDSVVLIGCGYMGLLTVQGLRATPLGDLTILDINQRNLDIANEYFPGCCFRTDTPEGQARIEKIKAQCYTFQGGIVENAMDYAYFQFADPRLRAAGLKIVIVFVHRDFQLEVWLSGVNRKAQCAWAEKLGAGAPPFLPSQDPARTDYILRAPVAAELSQGPAVLAALLDQLQQLRASLKAYL